MAVMILKILAPRSYPTPKSAIIPDFERGSEPAIVKIFGFLDKFYWIEIKNKILKLFFKKTNP